MALPVSAYLAGCGTKPFYFIQMADTQLGMISGGEDGNDFTEETDILDKVFSHINTMKPRPAFVAICGDLTNTPGHDKQIAEYKRLTGILKKILPSTMYRATMILSELPVLLTKGLQYTVAYLAPTGIYSPGAAGNLWL